MSLADQTDVFFGPVTRASARIYVRVTEVTGDAGWSITGAVRGPVCAGVRTLPTTVPLVNLGGTPLLASCVLLDPCTWTPDLPAAYRVQIEVRRHGKLMETLERTLGLRTLGPDGGNLRFEGERWVLRGVSIDDVRPAQVAELHKQFAALVTRSRDEAVLAAASSQGVLVAARLVDAFTKIDVTNALRQLTRWPAVAFVVLESDAIDASSAKQIAPNLLIGRRATPEEFAGADFVVCPANELQHFKEAASTLTVPILALRCMSPPQSIAEARAGCDRLQRDLVPLGDFAGYIV